VLGLRQGPTDLVTHAAADAGGNSSRGAASDVREPSAFWRAVFDIGKVLSRGLDAVVDKIASQHLNALFFTKLTDWASEHEFRFVVATDSPEPVYVDTSGALRAVIMGYECAPGFVPALADLCGKRDIKIRALHWFNVEPHLVGIAIDQS
jgi:hypothetical protein